MSLIKKGEAVMASHNDITGDKIITKAKSKAFDDNFDAIFRKEPKRIYTNEEIKSWHWVNDLELSEDEAQIMARDMGVEDE
jgi:hypothetical protein